MLWHVPYINANGEASWYYHSARTKPHPKAKLVSWPIPARRAA